MSKPGDFCRKNKDNLLGCSGEGRPTCKAPECLYGAEPCPNCNGFKVEGEDIKCNWCGKSEKVMLEFTIERSKIGKHTLFNAETGGPNCLVGHIIYQMGVRASNADKKGCYAAELPEPLHFLREKDERIPGGYAWNVATYSQIASASDKGDFDKAVSLLADHGIKVNLI